MDDFLDKHGNPFNQFFERLTRLIHLNILWLAGTLAGGIVLGLYPATFSVFMLIKNEFRRKDGPELLNQDFIRLYRQNFKLANGYGLVLNSLIGISLIDLWFAYESFILSEEPSVFGIAFTLFALLFSYIGFALWIYVPLTVAYFPNFKFKDVFKFALVSVFGTPGLTLKLLIILALSVVTFSIFISVTLFLGASLPIYLWLSAGHRKYRSFFVVSENENTLIVNIKYTNDRHRLWSLIRELNLQENTLDESLFKAKTYEHPDFDDVLSSVMLNPMDESLMGFIMTHRAEKKVIIQSMVVAQQVEIESHVRIMLQCLISQTQSLGYQSLEFNRQSCMVYKQCRIQEDMLLGMGFKIKDNSRLCYEW